VRTKTVNKCGGSNDRHARGMAVGFENKCGRAAEWHKKKTSNHSHMTSLLLICGVEQGRDCPRSKPYTVSPGPLRLCVPVPNSSAYDCANGCKGAHSFALSTTFTPSLEPTVLSIQWVHQDRWSSSVLTFRKT